MQKYQVRLWKRTHGSFLKKSQEEIRENPIMNSESILGGSLVKIVVISHVRTLGEIPGGSSGDIPRGTSEKLLLNHSKGIRRETVGEILRQRLRETSVETPGEIPRKFLWVTRRWNSAKNPRERFWEQYRDAYGRNSEISRKPVRYRRWKMKVPLLFLQYSRFLKITCFLKNHPLRNLQGKSTVLHAILQIMFERNEHNMFVKFSYSYHKCSKHCGHNFYVNTTNSKVRYCNMDYA